MNSAKAFVWNKDRGKLAVYNFNAIKSDYSEE